VSPQPTDRVLLVGVGSGYLAACLAARASSVRGLELREDLASMATSHLKHAGVGNVTVECRNAFEPEALGSGAYDVIVLVTPAG